MSDNREVGAGGRGSAFAGDARHRLATYGSLAPGRRNHHQLDGLAGRWFRGYVRGTLVDAGWGAGLGYPALVLDPGHRATPVDRGDVCLNYDKGWYESRHIPPPRSLADLAHLRYRDQLVVENPATSSPGLAFLLATVATYGDPGWQTYWRGLRANGVLWTLRPKGSPDLTESEMMRAGQAAGLVDVKVVSFSDLLTAEKFVIPVAKRSAHQSAG